ncbi:MAG: hypothetical protein WDK95_06740 [Syntrophorhabdaceae bacterium]
MKIKTEKEFFNYLKKIKCCEKRIACVKSTNAFEKFREYQGKTLEKIVCRDEETFKNVQIFLTNLKLVKCKILRLEDSDNFWEEYEYDENNVLIKTFDSDGYEKIFNKKKELELEIFE